MAGAQWKGGKRSGGKAAKAYMRHNDKLERLNMEHSNEDINLSETPNNWSINDLRYEQKCARYDKRLAEVSEGVRFSTGKNATTTFQSVIVYEPEDEETGERLNREQLHVFYGNVYDIACEMFGKENVIELEVHVDELHNYHDPKKGLRLSRVHGHLELVPAVPYLIKTKREPYRDENGDFVQELDKEGKPQFYKKDDPTGQGRWRVGDPKIKMKKVSYREALPEGEYRLNASAFASRENIIAFNQRIHEMCVREFGIDYMNGEGKHASVSVEKLKRESKVVEANEKVKQAEIESHIALEQASESANLAAEMEAEAKIAEARLEHQHAQMELIRGESYEHKGKKYQGLAGVTAERDAKKAESAQLDREIKLKRKKVEEYDVRLAETKDVDAALKKMQREQVDLQQQLEQMHAQAKELADVNEQLHLDNEQEVGLKDILDDFVDYLERDDGLKSDHPELARAIGRAVKHVRLAVSRFRSYQQRQEQRAAELREQARHPETVGQRRQEGTMPDLSDIDYTRDTGMGS